jgi:hypothetical protein
MCWRLRRAALHMTQLLYLNCLYWCLLLSREFSLRLSSRPCNNGLFSFNLVLRTPKKKSGEKNWKCILSASFVNLYRAVWFVLRIVSKRYVLLLYLELLVFLNENQSDLKKKCRFLYRHKQVSAVKWNVSSQIHTSLLQTGQELQ